MTSLTSEQIISLQHRHRTAITERKLIAEYVPPHGSFGRSTYYIIGDTWRKIGAKPEMRDRIKELGGEYDKTIRAWVLRAFNLPDDIAAVLDEIREIAHAEASKYENNDGESTAEMQSETFAEDHIAEDNDTSEAEKAPSEDDNLPAWFTPPGWWDLIKIYVKHRPGIAVVGPAGNGKTTATEMALTVLDIPFVSLSCTDRTEVLDLVGGNVLTAEGEQWRDGLITKAFREGKAVILDEADTLDPRVMMALQNALQDAGPDGKARFVNTPDGRVYPTASCPIILCMNTYGDGGSRAYNGRNKLDAASMDRLTVVSTNYENEVQILTARGYKKATAERIVKWAQETRTKIYDAGMTMTLSPRTMLRIAEGMEKFGWGFFLAVDFEFMNRIDPDKREYLK